MKRVTKSAPFVNEPVLTQRQYSLISGLDPVLTNNLIARNILEVDRVVAGRGRGTRLFTPLKAWEGLILNEAVKHHKLPFPEATTVAQVASRLATKGGWINHWAGGLSKGGTVVGAFMLVTWADDCYDAQIVFADKVGGPDFSSPDAARFLGHPFLVIPLSAFFEQVWKRSKAVTMPDQKA
jgi:hypothetical protein